MKEEIDPETKSLLFSYIEEGDKEYYATYDGEGNTEIIASIYDKPVEIAEILGISVDELFELNNGNYQQKDGEKYFLAGQTFKVPGVLDPHHEILQNRGSQEEETFKYAQWDAAKIEAEEREKNCLIRKYTSNVDTFRSLAIELYKEEGVNSPSQAQINNRIEELKKLNPNLKDGSLKGIEVQIRYNFEKELEISNANIRAYHSDYNQRHESEIAKGIEIGTKIQKYINENNFSCNDTEFKNIISEITPENVVGLLLGYKEVDKFKPLAYLINSERGSGKKEVMAHIWNALKIRAEKAGLNSTIIEDLFNEAHYLDTNSSTHIHRSTGTAIISESQEINPKDFTYYTRIICAQITTIESLSPEEKTKFTHKGININSALIDTGYNLYNTALNGFNKQIAEDGLYADVYEELKRFTSIGNNRNLDTNVQNELNYFLSSLEELEEINKTQGEEAFIKKFEEIFETKYDLDLINNYAINYTKYKNIVALEYMLCEMNKAFEGEGNLQHGLNYCSYEELVKYLKKYITITNPDIENPDLATEEFIKNYMNNIGVADKYTPHYSDIKHEYLRNLCENITKQLTEQKKLLSNGKNSDKLYNELMDQGQAIFGRKHDVIKRVTDYINSQEKGEIYVGIALKSIPMIAVGFITGTAGFSAVGISGLTTGISTLALDLINEFTGDSLTSSQELQEMLASACLNALLSSGSTGCREGAKAFFKGKTSELVKVTLSSSCGQVAISGLHAQYNKSFTIENFLLDIAFALTANYFTSTKPFNNAKKPFTVGPKDFTYNPGRGTRRVSSSGKKELKVEYFDREGNLGTITVNLEGEDYKKLITGTIDNINNLGELNQLKTSISNLETDDASKKEMILTLIDNRVKQLIENPNLISIGNNDEVSEECKNEAIYALEQHAKNLRADQIENITEYITSITDVETLNTVYSQLKYHEVNFEENYILKQVLDNKYAELMQMPPYEVDDCFILKQSKI